MIYDVDYFIKKFEAIPDENWCVNDFVDPDDATKMCAAGHCGERIDCIAFETVVLSKVLIRGFKDRIPYINDGVYGWDRVAPTPKARILAALYGVRDGYNPLDRVK